MKNNKDLNKKNNDKTKETVACFYKIFELFWFAYIVL